MELEGASIGAGAQVDVNNFSSLNVFGDVSYGAGVTLQSFGIINIFDGAFDGTIQCQGDNVPITVFVSGAPLVANAAVQGGTSGQASCVFDTAGGTSIVYP